MSQRQGMRARGGMANNNYDAAGDDDQYDLNKRHRETALVLATMSERGLPLPSHVPAASGGGVYAAASRHEHLMKTSHDPPLDPHAPSASTGPSHLSATFRGSGTILRGEQPLCRAASFLSLFRRALWNGCVCVCVCVPTLLLIPPPSAAAGDGSQELLPRAMLSSACVYVCVYVSVNVSVRVRAKAARARAGACAYACAFEFPCFLPTHCRRHHACFAPCICACVYRLTLCVYAFNQEQWGCMERSLKSVPSPPRPKPPPFSSLLPPSPRFSATNHLLYITFRHSKNYTT
jgi:hypothetical protein